MGFSWPNTQTHNNPNIFIKLAHNCMISMRCGRSAMPFPPWVGVQWADFVFLWFLSWSTSCFKLSPRIHFLLSSAQVKWAQNDNKIVVGPKSYYPTHPSNGIMNSYVLILLRFSFSSGLQCIAYIINRGC